MFKMNRELSQKACEEELIKFRDIEEKVYSGKYLNSMELQLEADVIFSNYQRGYDELLGPCKSEVLLKYKEKVGINRYCQNKEIFLNL